MRCQVEIVVFLARLSIGDCDAADKSQQCGFGLAHNEPAALASIWFFINIQQRLFQG